MPLYFAYGSNKDAPQMFRRCPDSKSIGIGLLPEHALGFTRFAPSSARRCGVADVLPKPGCEVWGVLYEVLTADLEDLDKSEGFMGMGHINAYDRMEMSVLQDGDPAKALIAEVYVVQTKSPTPLRPSQAYKALLVQGASEHGLPEKYCEMLRKLEVM